MISTSQLHLPRRRLLVPDRRILVPSLVPRRRRWSRCPIHAPARWRPRPFTLNAHDAQQLDGDGDVNLDENGDIVLADEDVACCCAATCLGCPNDEQIPGFMQATITDVEPCFDFCFTFGGSDPRRKIFTGDPNGVFCLPLVSTAGAVCRYSSTWPVRFTGHSWPWNDVFACNAGSGLRYDAVYSYVVTVVRQHLGGGTWCWYGEASLWDENLADQGILYPLFSSALPGTEAPLCMDNFVLANNQTECRSTVSEIWVGHSGSMSVIPNGCG